MSAAGNMTSETMTSEGTGTFMSNLIPVLTMLLIGYPLAPATIKTMLVGWILVVVAVTRSISREYFQITGSAMALRMTPARSIVRGRNR